MATLLERLRGQREQWVKADRFEFKLRRPTRLEMQKMPAGYLVGDLIVAFVVDWRGVTEQDIVGGDKADAVAFDKDVWSEWIADRPHLWPAILDALSAAFEEYARRQEDAAKN